MPFLCEVIVELPVHHEFVKKDELSTKNLADRLALSGLNEENKLSILIV